MQDLTNVFISKYVEDATGIKMVCHKDHEIEFVEDLPNEFMLKRDPVTYTQLSTALAALFIFVDEIEFAKKLMNKYGWNKRDEFEQMKVKFAMEIIDDKNKHMNFCMKQPLLACLLTFNSQPEQKEALARELVEKKELDPMKHNSFELALAEGLCRQLGRYDLIELIENKLKKA